MEIIIDLKNFGTINDLNFFLFFNLVADIYIFMYELYFFIKYYDELLSNWKINIIMLQQMKKQRTNLLSFIPFIYMNTFYITCIHVSIVVYGVLLQLQTSFSI